MLFNVPDTPQNCPFHCGHLDPGPVESINQTAFRSVQQFLQGSRSLDRPTDGQTTLLRLTIDRLNNMQRLTCRVSVLKRRVAGAITLIRFPRTFAFLLRILANLAGAV